VFAWAALTCTGPDQACGATPPDIVPWLALSGVILAVGAVVAARTARRAGS
jgi:hypothetical protein